MTEVASETRHFHDAQGAIGARDGCTDHIVVAGAQRRDVRLMLDRMESYQMQFRVLVLAPVRWTVGRHMTKVAAHDRRTAFLCVTASQTAVQTGNSNLHILPRSVGEGAV